MNEEPRVPEEEMTDGDLLNFFINHLDRIFCAKNQLVENLPELRKSAHFRDLEQAIGETVEVVDMQIGRMKQIYILLDSVNHFEHCNGLIGLLDEAFQAIGEQSANSKHRDLSILYYMQIIESVEVTSFRILIQVAGKLQRPDVEQLLRECYDEAREDRVLLKEISQYYI
jgi:ferritin-like metal-binding protein YciE